MLETQVRLSSVLCTNSYTFGMGEGGQRERAERSGATGTVYSLTWEREGREEWSGATGTVEPLNKMIKYSQLWQSNSFVKASFSFCFSHVHILRLYYLLSLLA